MHCRRTVVALLVQGGTTSGSAWPWSVAYGTTGSASISSIIGSFTNSVRIAFPSGSVTVGSTTKRPKSGSGVWFWKTGPGLKETRILPSGSGRGDTL